MARVNVFLKDELLNEINSEAKNEGTNRSSLIQSALEKYLASKRREREEEEEQKRMEEACNRMDRLASIRLQLQRKTDSLFDLIQSFSRK